MSTLSELFPSGGTQNNIEFVAQGTLANGQTVALRSDGKVEAISETSASNGTAVQFSTGNYAEEILSFPIPSTNQIVVAYQEAGIDNSFKAVVGTITANAIVFTSSPIAVSGGVAVTWIAGCFETGESKVVFAWTNNSNKLVALGGSVSGTGSSATISLGSASTISTSQITTGSVFLQDNPSASGKTQFIYRDQSASSAKVLTLSINSSNTIGTGGATTITSTSYPRGVGLTTEDDKSILIDSPNGGNLVLYVGSYNSGADTWSFNTGSPVALNSGDNSLYNNPVVVANNFIAIVFQNASGYPTVNSFTLSGTTLTAGTPLTLVSGGAGRNGFAYDATASKYVFGYRNSSGVGMYHTINFSGTAFTSVSSAIQFVASTVDVSVAYNASQGKTIFSFSDGGDSEKGKGQVYTLAISNASSFIGITNAAISSSATGEVAVKGGLSTGGNVLPYELSAGAQSVYKVGPQIQWQAVAYDSTNNKVVVAYSDNNSTGKAAVGTISGTTITWGTPVQFSSHNSPHIAIAYDTNAQKIVIGYKDNASAPYGGQAVVGTVSGTSISFGSPVQFAAFDMTRLTMTYDANAQKTVFAYLGQSNYTQAIVGTVSGTSISFGTAYTVLSEASGYKGITYDSTAQKVVLATQSASTTGKAAVGTVSGTNISFGTAATFVSTQISQVAVSYNAAANKTLICYRADGLSNQGKTFVATVSGTSISFGAISEFDAGGVNAVSATYDVAAQTNVISFRDEGNSNRGTSIAATITGTTATYSSPLVFYTGAIEYSASTYSTTSNRIVVVYKDTANNNQGAANSLALSNALTIGSNYFVQDDGTVSTTSSSNKAGKAISTTALNLVDPT